MTDEHLPENSLTVEIIQEMLERIENSEQLPAELIEKLRNLANTDDIMDWEKVKDTFVSFQGGI